MNLDKGRTVPSRGRIAPSPTGFLHLGHAKTFTAAAEQMQRMGGTLIFRMEDLDPDRCKNCFVEAALEDLRWWGLIWQEGPDIGGPFEPYTQSLRGALYLAAWRNLLRTGCIYPSPHSRKDVAAALSAPHEEECADPVFPVSLRMPTPSPVDHAQPGEVNWRFRVPGGCELIFEDSMAGRQSFIGQRDFGDFLVWRKDGFPSYELAVVVDDIAMEITHVLRGEDLLLSTARQKLLYAALKAPEPNWCHVPLIRDANGQRLAKRTPGLALRDMRSPDGGVTVPAGFSW